MMKAMVHHRYGPPERLELEETERPPVKDDEVLVKIHSFTQEQQNAWKIGVGRNWRDNGYGYQWWSVQAGIYRYNLA
jgi:hypothetical protein